MATSNRDKEFSVAFQSDRFLTALDPSSVKIDGRTLDAILLQCARFAEKIRFYGDDNKISGNWTSFFKEVYDSEKDCIDLERLKEMEDSGTMPPHLALLQSFIRLYSIQQEHLNGLTKRHLDFYYRDILRFSPKSGTVGNVPVQLKLIKGAASASVPKGTVFLAEKDSEGKQISYCSKDDYTVTPASVKHIIRSGKDKVGYGFALSSPLFDFGSGKITLHFPKSNNISAIKGISSLEYTSSNGWNTVSLTDSNKKTDENTNTEGETVQFTIPEASPVVTYDKNIHGGSYETGNPIIRFVIPADSLASFKDVKAKDISPNNVTLTDFTCFKLSNNYGEIKNDRGTQPFGPKMKGTNYLFFTSSVFQYLLENTISVNGLDISGQGAIEAEKQRYCCTFTSETEADGPTLSDTIKINADLGCDKNSVYSISPYGEMKCDSDDGVIWDEAYDTTEKLFIGCGNVVVGSSIALFFELEGQNERIPSIHVSYLDGKDWSSNNQLVISDTTSNFNKSGIIRFNLFKEMMNPHSIMDQECIWLKIICPNNISMPNAQGIVPHVIELEYNPLSLGTGMIGRPLPMGTITKTEHRIAGLEKVIQFREGFKGEYDEDYQSFNTRVSERLRHKGRAWSNWDYERIVLEKFPEIAAVKCISSSAGAVYSPGSVTLMLVPKFERGMESLSPLVSETIKTDVYEYVKERISPFVDLQIIHPKYEEVEVTCDVMLRQGFDDKEYYRNIIINSLINLFSPWIDSSDNIVKDKTFNESAILLFLEELPCVDYIKSLEIKVGEDKRLIGEGADIESTDSTKILTSSKTHNINIL